MNNRMMSKLLKLFTVLLGGMGLVFFLVFLPVFLQATATLPDSADWVLMLFQVLAGIGAVLMYLALADFWQICTRIGRNRSFCAANARALKQISALAAVDTILCGLGCALLFFNNLLHPSILLAGLGLIIIGCLIAVAARTLSYLVAIAEQIQTENELVV